jgi:epoxyqueuosine reductase
VPGTLSVISARLPYWPEAADARQVLADGRLAYVSRYALGRDYHKTVRSDCRNSPIVRQAVAALDLGEPFACRVFSDSAPVLETEFALQIGRSPGAASTRCR